MRSLIMVQFQWEWGQRSWHSPHSPLASRRKQCAVGRSQQPFVPTQFAASVS